MNYKVVYDVTKDAFPLLAFVCIVASIVAVVIALRSILELRKTKKDTRNSKRRKKADFGEIVFVSVILCAAVAFGIMAYVSNENNLGIYQGDAVNAYLSGDYFVAEGKIENFEGDRHDDSFMVDGTEFRYRKSGILVLDHFYN